VSILGMPTFREPCSSLQGEEQPDTQAPDPRPDELQGSRNVGIPRMDLIMEETYETHNLYISVFIFMNTLIDSIFIFLHYD